MIRANERVLKALHGLHRNDPDFKIVVEWMREYLAGLDRQNRNTMDEKLVRWTQGQAQFVSEFLDMIENSQVNLEAIEKEPKGFMERMFG